MTFGAIKARISDEMKRGELSASATAVQNSVLDAIKFFEGRRFPFNEFIDATHTTTSGTYAVTITATLRIVNLDAVKVTVNNRLYALTPRTWQELESIDSGQWTGYPDYYARYDEDLLRLYPTPNGTYTVTLSGTRKLETVSAGASASASNAWTGVAEEAVRLHAKGTLFRDQLRAPELAGAMFQEAERWMREYRKTAGQYARGGRLRKPPGYF